MSMMEESLEEARKARQHTNLHEIAVWAMCSAVHAKFFYVKDSNSLWSCECEFAPGMPRDGRYGFKSYGKSPYEAAATLYKMLQDERQ